MRLLSVYDIFSGCAWYRSIIPAHAADLAGHEVVMRSGTMYPEDIEWCDTFQMQRLFQPEALDAVKKANRLGKLTVYDLDDDLWAIGRTNAAHDFWAKKEHSTGAVKVIRECAKVTTTTESLAETLSKFHDDVSIVPNALSYGFEKRGGEHEGLVIGWAGGPAHEDDLKMIAPILYDVLDARPDVRCEIAGAGLWMEHPRIKFVQPVEITRYHHLLSRFDIGIAPIIDNRFNRAKSDLKPLEYAGIGIPCVASNVGDYRDLAHGKTCYLADNAKDWRKYLLRLIDDEEDRKRIGREALSWAQTRTIEKMLPRWVSAWSSPATSRRTGCQTPSEAPWLSLTA